MNEVIAAIVAVMGQVKWVAETGKNTHGGYSYASDADLLNALRPAMVEQGLVIFPLTVKHHQVTPHKSTQYRLTAVMTYRVAHTSGQHIDVEVMASAHDSLDKDAYKAMTGAYKYVLRQVFAVSTGDDPERDRKREPERRQQKPKQPANWKQDRKRPTAPAKDATTKKGHDPSWEADRPRFCAWAGDHGGYDLVRDWCKAEYGMKPSELPQMRRDSMRRYVDSDAGQDSLSGFRDHVKGTK
jgi:hypothetical protein